MRTFDYIIVGQGIAGSLLYHQLSKRGKNVLVIDEFNPSSSSNIAAGIIHPITGRRIVKTWMADELIPFAEITYRELENLFSEKFFYRKNILELLCSVKELNDWNERSAAEGMEKYFSDENTDALYINSLRNFLKKISVTQSSWLDVAKLIKLFREQLVKSNSILEEKFEFVELKTLPVKVGYKNIIASKIIFCEGYNSIHNPFWSHLPFLTSKGEVLTIYSKELNIAHIINRNIFILPLGNNLFKVGSTYDWNDRNDSPTEKAKAKIVSQLNEIVKVPYKIVDHKAAVRPTVKGRRPFIGLHSENKCIGIFNGLGTKGVLLAPFFASHFADYLEGGNELMKEVDVMMHSHS